MFQTTNQKMSLILILTKIEERHKYYEYRVYLYLSQFMGILLHETI
jgi:hypothetical protein